MAELRSDPTRTTMLRKAFMADMRRRFRKLSKAIIELVVTLDAFGLDSKGPVTFNVEPQEFRFQTDDQKLVTFRGWLQGQIDEKILETDALNEPWTSTYIQSAYTRGSFRAFDDARRAEGKSDDFFQGSREEFFRSSFAGPVRTSKLRLVSTRTFEQLRGISANTSQQLNRILADGLSQGLGPRAIARQMVDQIDTITKTRANVLARTETINAFAEGQLDSFEALGIDELGIKAEFATAGDDRVCVRCEALEGRLFTVEEARGVIPVHPNCRCAWIPASQVVSTEAEGTATPPEVAEEAPPVDTIDEILGLLGGPPPLPPSDFVEEAVEAVTVKVFTPNPRRARAFQNLSDAQRGLPESAKDLVEIVFETVPKSLQFTEAVEHIGDLTNRMTNRTDARRGFGFATVKHKVDTHLRRLKEFNRKGIKFTGEAQVRALKNYAEEHAKLTVFNKPQRLARNAAIALGEQRLDDAIKLLEELQTTYLVDEITWNQAAGRFRHKVPA